GESGAINESMSDIFGFMMDSTNYTIGEEVVRLEYFPSGALRDMADPNQGGSNLSHPGWQPKHVNEQYFGSANHGGVHINSGIPNHAFYLLATSAGSNMKAGHIFYRALTHYLTRSSVFTDLRRACVYSAIDLFGEDALEVDLVHNAFESVGIMWYETEVVDNTLPVNPGQDYLLFADMVTADPNTLYRSSVIGTQFFPMSTTEIGNRPSVTDNGSLAVFVGGDNRIYGVDLTNPQNPQQTVIHSEPVWSNVAISKNGRHIAANTIYEDAAIFVLDRETDIWFEFELYNPTYSEGLTSAGPVYADAMEWDHSGEYLVYDAYNELINNNGDDLSYWDVGFMRVWDNAANGIGDGEIQKLYSSLPQDVSIGNPSFSKNSPHIIAFDYLDLARNIVAVVGLNMETNTTSAIYYNNSLGWPSYSKLDDNLAFTTYSASKQVIGGLSLGSDKISAAGPAYLLVDAAKWPVYYADGERDLIIADPDADTPDPDPDTDPEPEPEPQTQVGVLTAASSGIRLYPNPFRGVINIQSASDVQSISVFNSTGIRVDEWQMLSSTSLDVSGLIPGLYLIEVVREGERQIFKMLKN
ncbi:MAG: M4 family metallopeptidase, partial [Cytophagaceae bacterium]